MTLGELIDLDRRIHRGAGEGDASLLAELRRRSTAAPLRTPEEEEAFLLEWSRGKETGREASLGELAVAAAWWTALLLFLLGGLSGAGAAAALLSYDGTRPINVLWFLGAIVGTQVLLLPLLLLAFLFRGRLGTGRRRGGLLALLWLQAAGALARLSGARAERDLGAELTGIVAGPSLLAQAQPVLLLSLAQVFGIAFNLAVAGVLFFSVLFSDLSFSWSTTLQVDASRIHDITTMLSSPWATFLPEARPSIELVESTRFVRLDGSFSGGDREAGLRAGGWWPFLLAAVITYGLLPRLLALAAGLLLLGRQMRQALRRSSDVQALRDRLRVPVVAVHPPQESVQEPVRADGAAAPPEAESAPGRPPPRGLDLAVVFWAYDELPPEEAIADFLAGELDGREALRLQAGGVEVREQDVLSSLREAIREKRVEGVAVFFEPFEPPKTDARRFLQSARVAAGRDSPLIVFLAEVSGGRLQEAEAEDRQMWDRAIRALDDPMLLLGGERCRK